MVIRTVATVRGQAVLESAVDILGNVWLVLRLRLRLPRVNAKAKELSRRPSGCWENRCESAVVYGTEE